MATLQAATTSTGAIVSDPQAVRELCETYCFGTLNWEITEEGEFTKCRFPVLAKRYVVRDGEVLHADLSSLEPINE